MKSEEGDNKSTRAFFSNQGVWTGRINKDAWIGDRGEGRGGERRRRRSGTSYMRMMDIWQQMNISVTFMLMLQENGE